MLFRSAVTNNPVMPGKVAFPPVSHMLKTMNYVALLRGINVGGKRKVEMPRLKALLESAGYTDVVTYLNSGNVLFSTGRDAGPDIMKVQVEVTRRIEEEFGFPVPTLVKLRTVMRRIAESIPADWQNDDEQKSDVAYLFPEIDSISTIDALPWKREAIDVRYIPGALLWNVRRERQNESRLSKIASHRLYDLMTVRNVNTARFLGG
jgi:uncharacterized protein (DUF1697 family)